jgi:hypothetical protein
MVQTLDIGMGDHRASPGDHICALYSSPAERNALLASYVRSALRSPHKCICVLDFDNATQMTQMVTHVSDDDEIDLQGCLASRQLEFVSSSAATDPWGRLADKIGLWKGARHRRAATNGGAGAGRGGDASQRHGSEARRRDVGVGQDRKRWVRSETLDLVICRRADPVGQRRQRHRQWARSSSPSLDAVAVLDDTAARKPESFD